MLSEKRAITCTSYFVHVATCTYVILSSTYLNTLNFCVLGAILRIINIVNVSDPGNLISIKEGDVNGTVPLCVQLVSGGEIDSVQEQNGLGRSVPLLLTTNGQTTGSGMQ